MCIAKDCSGLLVFKTFPHSVKEVGNGWVNYHTSKESADNYLCETEDSSESNDGEDLHPMDRANIVLCTMGIDEDTNKQLDIDCAAPFRDYNCEGSWSVALKNEPNDMQAANCEHCSEYELAMCKSLKNCKGLSKATRMNLISKNRLWYRVKKSTTSKKTPFICPMCNVKDSGSDKDSGNDNDNGNDNGNGNGNGNGKQGSGSGSGSVSNGGSNGNGNGKDSSSSSSSSSSNSNVNAKYTSRKASLVGCDSGKKCIGTNFYEESRGSKWFEVSPSRYEKIDNREGDWFCAACKEVKEAKKRKKRKRERERKRKKKKEEQGGKGRKKRKQ